MPYHHKPAKIFAMDHVEIQHIKVARIIWPELLRSVAQTITDHGRATVSYVNLHVLNLSANDDGLRTFLQNVDICYCDGRGVQWAATMLGKSLPERMTGADWIEDLCAEASKRSWRIAWIGGRPGVTAAARDVLHARHPDLQIVFTEHGFHDPKDPTIVERINATTPDILLVGMGSPVQEAWVALHRPALNAPVVWCLGATADYVAGELRRGPKWLTERHEWLARLLIEPRRLARRYIIGNPTFFLRLIRDRNS